MPKRGEHLQVIIPRRRGERVGGNFLKPQYRVIPTESVTVGQGHREGFNGLSGRRISKREIRAIASLALKKEITPDEAARGLQRVTDAGEIRPLIRGGFFRASISERVANARNSILHEKGKSEYKKAAAQEKRNRKEAKEIFVSPIQYGYARMTLQPVNILTDIHRGLQAETPSPEALNDIQDAVRAAIQQNFLEFQHPAIGVTRRGIRIAKSVMAITKNKIVKFVLDVADIFPAIKSVNAIVDWAKFAMDRVDGKRAKLLRSDVAAMALDANPLPFPLDPFPFYNLANMANARTRVDDIILRGSMNIALDEMKNEASPHRLAVAQAVLRSVPYVDQIPAAKDIPDDSGKPLPRRNLYFAFFENQWFAPLEGLWPGISKRKAELRKREKTRWKKTIATVLDQARTIVAQNS